MFDYVRIAAAVGDLRVCDVTHNTEDIKNKIKYADGFKSDVIVFPELSVTGYTCGDLFFQKELLKSALKAVREIVEFTVKIKGVVAFGVPLSINGQLYNCGVVCRKGKIYGIIPKTFLPVYNEFYEKRWFSSSETLKTTQINSLMLGFEQEYLIPVSRNLMFSLGGEYSFGVEICEDLWAPLSPGTFLALNGAEILLNLSASNETTAKCETRSELISQQSAKCICTYAYVSSGADESTSDLVFSGKSVIAENGAIIKENEGLIASDYVMICDTDLGKIKAERMKVKSFNDTASLYGKFEKTTDVYIPYEKFKSDGEYYNVSAYPFIPKNEDKRLRRCNEMFEIQTAGLVKRLKVTGGKPVIGISGGLDSTLALLICVNAIRKIGKSESEIVAVTMPGFGTTGRTYNNAVKLMESLGVAMREVSIKEACEQHFSDIGHDIKKHDVTYENAQARERTQILMDIANQVNGFVIGTGDLSELALGWCTYNGDQMSMYGVNSGVPKTLIKWIIESVIESGLFKASEEYLKDIIDTPISPELLPPDESGKIMQKTEDLVGPYELHDFFLYYVLRFGFSPEKICYLAKKAFKGQFDKETIIKWEKVFYRRFFNQQFKRNALPDGVKVGNIGLSPRGDWRMPSDASSGIWLEAVEKL